MKSAFETCDELPIHTVPIYKVSEEGIPIGRINVDLLEKDYGLFWEFQERKLYLLLAFCSLIFLLVLMGAR